MPKAILRVSDNINTVSLLSKPPSGIFLRSWRPAIAGAKQGGVFQSSSLSEGRQLAVRMFANATETFELKIGDESQDLTIADIQDLIDLLENAIAFSTGNIQQNPVYIQAKARCETNSRFALIVSYSWQELGNPFAQPFIGVSQLALMDDITLNIERGHWGSKRPGESDCVLASSVQAWQFDEFWQLNTSLPASDVDSLLQTANGDIYAGEAGEIFRTIDNGASWLSNTALPAGDVRDMIQTANGDIYAADFGDIWRSVDNGASWAINTGLPSTQVSSLLQTANDDIYAGEFGNILRSTDGGAIWAVNTNLPLGDVRSMIQTANGDIYASDANRIWKSEDNGASWNINFAIASGTIFQLLQTANGDIYAATNVNSQLWKTTDNGLTWFINANSFSGGALVSLLQTVSGDIYLGTNGEIWKSQNNGLSWELNTTVPTDNVFSLLEATNGSLYGGEVGDIFRAVENLVDMGRGATCTNQVYIGNKQNIGNLTHIKIFNTVTFSDIFPITTFPQELFPNPMNGAGDILYFGQDTAVSNTGPFAGLVFDLDEIVEFSSTYAAIWEYFNGAWVALAVRDSTDTGTGPLRVKGVNSVHWEQPSDWITTAIDGVTAYWVRLRVTTASILATPASQQNRDIYTINRAFINVSQSVVAGEITAILRQKIQNQTDENGRTFIITGSHTGANNQAFLTDIGASFDTDGIKTNMVVKNLTDGSQAVITAFTATTITGTLAGGTEDDWDTNDVYEVIGLPLWENRVICGLRSSNLSFQAYLNVADEQNPTGIAVTATGANTTFVTDATAPTGRSVTYNPAGVEAMTTQVTISLDALISPFFRGKFHVFLRVQRTAGAITDFDVRLQIVSGSGGIEFTTQSKQIQTTTKWELLDFGAIKLPVGGRFKSTDLGDTTEIRIQASAASGVPNLNMYDIILIPTDEWAGDFIDFANNNDSIIGGDDIASKLLDIDSLTNPKVDIQSLVRTVQNELITSIYDPISPNKQVLQANTQQRLWFLAAQTDQTGTLTAWIAPPEIAHSLQLFRNDRWLTMRGLE